MKFPPAIVVNGRMRPRISGATFIDCPGPGIQFNDCYEPEISNIAGQFDGPVADVVGSPGFVATDIDAVQVNRTVNCEGERDGVSRGARGKSGRKYFGGWRPANK